MLPHFRITVEIVRRGELCLREFLLFCSLLEPRFPRLIVLVNYSAIPVYFHGVNRQRVTVLAILT